MIRFFVLVGIVGGALVAYLTTYGVGEIAQLPPEESLLTRYREEGKMPESKSLEEDHSAEDLGAFEVPEEDEAYLEAAIEAMGDMPGMNMDGMNMEGSSEGGAMKMDGTEGGTMKMGNAEGGTTEGGTMKMGNAEGSTTEGGTMQMGNAEGGATEGGTMKMGNAEGGTTEGGTMQMGNAEGGTMKMETAEGGSGEGMAMSPSNQAMMGEGGLLVTDDGAYDREITLSMEEWTFSEMAIDVKMGERIKFTVKNDGQIPHEFMFMSPALMQAVTYRATRADWNLYEHEALFEQALVLPGGEFTFVLKVMQPGSWMFMCMLPYHMQMGMMGQMATEGMAMDM